MSRQMLQKTPKKTCIVGSLEKNEYVKDRLAIRGFIHTVQSMKGTTNLNTDEGMISGVRWWDQKSLFEGCRAWTYVNLTISLNSNIVRLISPQLSISFQGSDAFSICFFFWHYQHICLDCGLTIIHSFFFSPADEEAEKGSLLSRKGRDRNRVEKRQPFTFRLMCSGLN